METSYLIPLKTLLSATLADRTRRAYAEGRPYPHLVLDGFFSDDLLDACAREFPRPDQIEWIHYSDADQEKLEARYELQIPPLTRRLIYELNGQLFLRWLSAVTGIPGLISDPYLEGGGLHQIERGGRLAVHVDFNKHRATGLDRRLNLLLYLNRDWQEEWGGHLEMWSDGRCEKRVLPLFNRMVIFGTTDTSYHGHPQPLACPEGTTRKSIALYYYTNGRPSDERGPAHGTLFRGDGRS